MSRAAPCPAHFFRTLFSSVAAEHAAEAAEVVQEGVPLLLAATPATHNALREAGERQALQPDAARAGQRGKEQPFAAEQHRFQVARPLDVELDVLRERDDAAGVHAQPLAVVQLALDDAAAGVDEGHAVALELLQDEAFAAEEAGAEPLLEGDADPGAEGGAQE